MFSYADINDVNFRQVGREVLKPAIGTSPSPHHQEADGTGAFDIVDRDMAAAVRRCAGFMVRLGLIDQLRLAGLDRNFLPQTTTV